MIIKQFVVAACCAGFGIGCCVGGVSNAYDALVYDHAMSSPDFFHLVDKFGNPVRQEVY